ncbi:hypothetical protein [Microbacterium sp. ZW T5_56]|uniref:hypothetical protein n=1 Tax=Microbacterium sp. ZW T5_56 TaxID=3378081 RepID=UPI00385303F9
MIIAVISEASAQPSATAPDQLDVIAVLARGISEEVSAQVESHLKGDGAKKKRTRHLWCVVLGAVCRAYDEVAGFVSKSLDEAVDAVIDLLRRKGTDSYEAADILFNQKGVARAFDIDAFDWLRVPIKHAVKSVLATVVAIGEEATMKYLRLIGAIVCPDADRHPVIVKHCIWPLLRGPFSAFLEQELQREMREWLLAAYEFLPRPESQ